VAYFLPPLSFLVLFYLHRGNTSHTVYVLFFTIFRSSKYYKWQIVPLSLLIVFFLKGTVQRDFFTPVFSLNSSFWSQ
jgi:hypothetical protein